MKVAIIADDLTGANATAALLSTQGFTTLTCLDNPEYAEDYDVVSFPQTPGLSHTRKLMRGYPGILRLLTQKSRQSVNVSIPLCGGIWGQKWMRLLTVFRN